MRFGSVEWAHEYNKEYGKTYTFEAEGVSVCHLPLLTGGGEDEPTPQDEDDFNFACDMHEPCKGTLEEMRAQAHKWKSRFPEHRVVIYSRTCIDGQGEREDDGGIYEEFFVEEVNA